MRFTFETMVPRPINDVFEFHLYPGNLLQVHADWGCTHLLDHDRMVRTGSVTWIAERLWHIMPVVVAIEHTVVPPCCIVDRMVHGPFARE